MNLITNNLLTLLIFFPTLGALAVLLVNGREAVRRTALVTSIITGMISLVLLFTFDYSAGGQYAYMIDGAGGTVQMVQEARWIPALNIFWRVGIDGLSLPLVLLTTIIFILSCVASWNIEKFPKGYFCLFLLLETGVLGTFLALDFFLFYVFFEVSLVPMYFLIGIWGGPRREYAAIKFFLYTLVGSIALLIALIATYLYSKQAMGEGTFDLIRLAAPAAQQALQSVITPNTGIVLFFLLMVGFLVKVPSVPLHTWLPDAHVEAPTPISMILAAILLKMGGYGIFRIAYPLFPEAAKAMWWVVALIGVVSIIYGALCAMAQTDFKKLVAYSSVSHMGLVVLGAAMMTETAVNGAIFMMVAHGITSAAMFFIVGVIYERAHHRELSRFGGIATTMPVYFGFSTVACMANLGLPGLCGFIGEVMVLLGSFQAAREGSILMNLSAGNYWWIITFAVIACFGVVLTAGYMLWTIQRVYLGPTRPEYADFPEVDAREITVLAPLTALAILLGILPAVFVFVFTDRTVDALTGLLDTMRVATGM